MTFDTIFRQSSFYYVQWQVIRYFNMAPDKLI